MSPSQVRLVRGLLSKAGLDRHKEDIVASFSDDRTVSLSNLTYNETQALVKYLRNQSGQLDNPADRMRRKILSMAHEMHWELTSGRIDMDRVNNWCIRFSGQNKPLNDFKLSELPALVTQFEIVYKEFLKGI